MLHLAHRSLHPQQQAIVRVTRIVDTVLVQNQRTDQTAELEQRVPVAAVASKTGGFDLKVIAVGAPITGRPPHRSGHAACPHPAPTSGV